jgi:multidrug efflux pump
LVEPEDFGRIVVRRDEAGGVVRLRDVARVELGGQNYAFASRSNGELAVPVAVFLQPGANALATMDAVRERLAEIAVQFPDGLEYRVPYDTTEFVRISIEEVVKTLFEAIALVFAVVFLFLGNWRATLIPTLAVPVSLIGTFAGMLLLGFSINTLTLFGMVLAIGIVVDDAIVVLENVERIMHQEHLSPVEATRKAMRQVTGPVIAIVLVLTAVFVPVAFVGGLSGVMYQQFAITIAVSVAISGLVALTLTPALCALILRPEDKATFRWLDRFNAWFDRVTGRYVAGAGYLLRHGVLTLALFVATGLGALLLLRLVPGALVPNEDQGTIIVSAILPDGASLSRTNKVVSELESFYDKGTLVDGSVSLIGYDLLSGALKSNVATQFVSLTDWDERHAPGSDTASFARTVMGYGAGNVQDAFVLGINPPPIRGLSTTGGFEFYVESRTGADYRALSQAVSALIAAAGKDPTLGPLRTLFSANSPQFQLDIDRDKAEELGVNLAELFEATQATFGGLYVNDFSRDGRTYQVQIQAESGERDEIADLNRVAVRGVGGQMVPLTTLVTPKLITGPEQVERFNAFPAIKVLGDPAPGVSSGEAIAAIERLAQEHLPEGYSMSWIGSAYQEKAIGASSVFAFVGGIVLVFLILAAQYERWSLPFAVMLSIPFAVLGAAAAVLARGLYNDLYFQVGMVTLIGLSAKNAILIVEFAAANVRAGMGIVEAALLAARQRFRPIVMTSLAFILGVLPLAISSGAGAAARHSIGTGVIGGMLASTFIASLFVPSLFRWMSRRDERRITAAEG